MRYESNFLNKYGEKIPVEVSANYIVDAGNQYIVIFSHSISKRKKSENRLRLNEEKFRLFTETNRDTIIHIDRKGQIKYCSPVVKKMFGFEVKEIEKEFLLKLIPTEHQDAVKNAMHDIIEDGLEIKSLDIKMLMKNGNFLDIEASIMPFKRNNKVLGVHANLRDITEKIKWEHDLDQAFLKYENIIMESEVLNDNLAKEIAERKRIEEELVKARYLADSANKAKSEFLANMSHEIRTPLNAVLGFAEILKEKLSDFKEYREYLEGIDTGGKTLLSLINDILDLSKIEAGRLEIQKEPVDMQELFMEVNQIFKKKIENKGLDLVMNIDNALPKCIELDHTRIRQILFNLVGNAVKFTSQGTITMSAKLIEKKDNDLIDMAFYVSDTGLGIPRKQQKIIFSPFKQQEGQSTRKYGGTGLGLTITKRLVEMMEGDIKVESKIGKGSEFIVILNNVKMAEPLSVELRRTSTKNYDYKYNHAKILLVEDNVLNRQVFSGYLEKYDFEITEAQNGQQALDILKDFKPDLIFMDLRMPVMGGIEATQKIKNKARLKYIPVIALSASMINNYAENEIKLFDDVLLKPITKQDLISVLAKFIDHEPLKKNPITVKTKTPDDYQALSVNKMNHKNKEELILIFNKKINPLLDNLKDFVDIEETKKLGEILMETGVHLKVKQLSQTGEKLNSLANQFKIKNIEILLNDLRTFKDGIYKKA